jgi:hypothetical protein
MVKRVLLQFTPEAAKQIALLAGTVPAETLSR